MPETPDQVLERLYAKVEPAQGTPIVKDTEVLNRIEYVARCPSNRAGVRLVMACMLGKIDHPEVDPRNPYTEIGGDSSFSALRIPAENTVYHDRQRPSHALLWVAAGKGK